MRNLSHRPCRPRALVALVLGLIFALAAPRALADVPDAPDEALEAFQSPDMPVRIGSPALLEVAVAGDEERLRLHELGLDVIDARPGRSARVLGWPGAEAALRQAGFTWRVLEADFGAALARASGRPWQPAGSAAAPGAPAAPTAAPPLGSGSMGGYYTLAEVDQVLADLVAADTHNIVGSIVQIGTSRQARPIKALRIANKSLPDHSRPRVLITSLHHAREGISLCAVLDFMKRLTTGYGVDPNITYLVDQREIWFIPVLNPDGYQINQNTWTSSGAFGMWRKNARDNDSNGTINTQDGVDINRNYLYRWGYDNVGSSNVPSNESYRGTSAWSEPETRAIRDLAILHQFSTINNFHSYGGFCIYPWGYMSAACPDSSFLLRLALDMTQDVAYGCGYSSDQLYRTNGDADDWFYGDVNLKPRGYPFTTEVGDANDNFWPPAAKIPALAAAHYRTNMVLAYAAGAYVSVEKNQVYSTDGWFHPGGSCQVELTLRNAGLLATTGAVHVTATTSVPGITVTDAASNFPALNPGATATPAGGDRLGLTASVYVPPGTLVPLIVTITDGGAYVLRDTTAVIVGQPVVALSDDGSHGMTNWEVNCCWGIETYLADSFFSDSPGQNYATSTTADLTMAPHLSLAGAGHAYLTFQSSWDIEIGADAGRVQISTNNGATWTSLPGRQTHPGHGTTGAYIQGTQGLNEPVYEATRRLEVSELIDLTPWAGLGDLRLRFRLTTDQTNRRGGWFVDDVQVTVYPNLADGVPEQSPAPPRPSLSAAWPNPFQGGTRLTANFAAPTVFRAAVYTVDGRLVRALAAGLAAAGPRDFAWDGRLNDGQSAASGAYFISLQWTGGSATQRVVRVR